MPLRVWFLDLRKAALTAFVLTTVSLSAPVWNSLAVVFSRRQAAGTVTMMVAAFLVLLTLPLFYFALWRGASGWRVPPRSRAVCLAAAMALSALAVVHLTGVIGPVRSAHAGEASLWSDAVLAWSVWVAFEVARMLLLTGFGGGATLLLVEHLSLLAAPYVVWRAGRS